MKQINKCINNLKTYNTNELLDLLELVSKEVVKREIVKSIYTTFRVTTEVSNWLIEQNEKKKKGK